MLSLSYMANVSFVYRAPTDAEADCSFEGGGIVREEALPNHYPTVLICHVGLDRIYDLCLWRCLHV